jgi:hypothetical protein
LSDVAELYETDIGSSVEALENRLMFQRKRNSGPFKDLPRKHQLKDLSLNQRWSLHLDLMRDWMHFRTRCIVPLRREVKVSAALANLSNSAVDEVIDKLRQGQSLKHRVSRSVLKSFKAKELREDPLLWQWSIHHFHLGDFSSDLGYAQGTDRILFAYVDQSVAVLIGLGTHYDFSKRWLIEHLFEAAPELLEKFTMKGIKGPDYIDQISDEHRGKLWKRFIVPMTHCGREIYPPGGGVTSSGHASRIVNNQAQILRAISRFDTANLLVLNGFAPVRIVFDGVRVLLRHENSVVWKGSPFV